MSVYFALWAEEVWVVRRGPGARKREWLIQMLDEPEHGVIEVGADVRVGDEIYKTGLMRRRKMGRVVADVDWDRQTHLKRGVITWAGPTRIRANQKETQMALNIQLHGMRLLDRLYDQTTTDPFFYDTDEFVTENNLPEGSGRLLVQHLASRGFVDPILTFGGKAEAKLTAQGIDYVQQIRAERSDSVRRSRELQQRMLRWLHNQEHRGTPQSDWTDFFASDDAVFYGDRFNLAELERQAEYLVAKGLITSMRSWQAANGTLKPSLTAAGQDCVMDFGGNVSDYVNRQNGGSTTTNNITMTSSTGNIVVASDNVQQNLETGIDTRKLLEFAGFVRQVVPTLGLPEDEQARLDAEAAELHQAAEEVAPDRNLIKRLWDAVMAGLSNAAPTIVTNTATAMGNDAIRAITGH